MHAGLTFNRNGDTFRDTYIVLKPNKDLLGNWTEIIFSTNWHPDPEKGFMKVWIDGKLKVDFKGRSNNKKKGKELSLRYGLYSSHMSRYKTAFDTQTMPQRVIFLMELKKKIVVKNYSMKTNVKYLHLNQLMSMKFLDMINMIKNCYLIQF